NSILPAIRAGIQYLRNMTGPLCSNIAEAGAFVKRRETSSRPDWEFHFGPVFFIDHGFTRPQPHGISFGPVLLHPKSNGMVSICSPNPLDAPVIQPRFLTEPEDLDNFIEALQCATELSRQPAFQEIIKEPVVPDTEPVTREDYIRLIHDHAQTLYHPTGSCRMGTADRGVVDDHLRVHGVEGLRICDASVLPDSLSSNPQATIMMMAEHFSDMLFKH
ncbi:MAG TPA: GMC oxidoreductase, partial [Saprospiraceae bacterium]|nr:GMC oxidoreductase [Saprospiraceae bacterium]